MVTLPAVPLVHLPPFLRRHMSYLQTDTVYGAVERGLMVVFFICRGDHREKGEEEITGSQLESIHTKKN